MNIATAKDTILVWAEAAKRNHLQLVDDDIPTALEFYQSRCGVLPGSVYLHPKCERLAHKVPEGIEVIYKMALAHEILMDGEKVEKPPDEKPPDRRQKPPVKQQAVPKLEGKEFHPPVKKGNMSTKAKPRIKKQGVVLAPKNRGGRPRKKDGEEISRRTFFRRKKETQGVLAL